MVNFRDLLEVLIMFSIKNTWEVEGISTEPGFSKGIIVVLILGNLKVILKLYNYSVGVG